MRKPATSSRIATAIGAIIAGSTQLEFGRAGAIWCPGTVADATGIVFIAEAAATPVLQSDLSGGATLALQKLSFSVVMTDELLTHSNFETMLRNLIAAKLQIGCETYMLDDTVGSTTRPPGLRYNIAAETASSTTTIEGMTADLGLITSKVAGVAGLTDTIIVASPKQASKIWARLPLYKIPVYASSALADGVVIAFACSGVAVCGSPDAPRIELSSTGVFHMDDSAPAEIVTSGGVLAAPVRSVSRHFARLCASHSTSRGSRGLQTVSYLGWKA